MPDLTNFQIHVYACPHEQQAAVLAVLEEHGLCIGCDSARPPREPLSLTSQYGANGLTVGDGAGIARRLREAAATATRPASPSSPTARSRRSSPRSPATRPSTPSSRPWQRRRATPGTATGPAPPPPCATGSDHAGQQHANAKAGGTPARSTREGDR
jgi:hypothetical protein